MEDRLANLHDRKQSTIANPNQLQNIVQFNEELLNVADTELFDVLDADQSDRETEWRTDSNTGLYEWMNPCHDEQMTRI